MVTRDLQSNPPHIQQFPRVFQQGVLQMGTSNQDDDHMQSIHLLVVKACSEAVNHQHELLSMMARHLNLAESQILYEWGNGKFKQGGSLNKGEWSYLFHGMECDFKNTFDGRFLRVNFGPKGRTD